MRFECELRRAQPQPGSQVTVVRQRECLTMDYREGKEDNLKTTSHTDVVFDVPRRVEDTLLIRGYFGMTLITHLSVIRSYLSI